MSQDTVSKTKLHRLIKQCRAKRTKGDRPRIKAESLEALMAGDTA